jgi:hypothetical protein
MQERYLTYSRKEGKTMKVKTYELIPNIEGTFKLIINGDIFSNNFFDLNLEWNLVQVDVCDHCFVPGCSDQGYVEVLEIHDQIVWKEPLNKKFRFANREFTAASGLRIGSLFWDKELYEKFQDELITRGRDVSASVYLRITTDDIVHLWKINGFKAYAPDGYSTCTLEFLEEERIGMYSEVLTERECDDLFQKAKNILVTTDSMKVKYIEDESMKVVMMFDKPVYREWVCFYLSKGEIFYTISEELVVSFS